MGGHDLVLGLNRVICLGKSWSWSALALVWWRCWNVDLWKNAFFCNFPVPYRRWILSLTLKSLQSRIQFHFISWHWQDYELCMYLVTILTEGCSDDHGCMSRILSYLVFAWSTTINCDQPRSTWAIWRRNPLWSARVAPCMWTRCEERWGLRNFARNCLLFSVIGCKGAQLVRYFKKSAEDLRHLGKNVFFCEE